jgi:hypothetical protein
MQPGESLTTSTSVAARSPQKTRATRKERASRTEKNIHLLL